MSIEKRTRRVRTPYDQKVVIENNLGPYELPNKDWSSDLEHHLEVCNLLVL